MTQIGQPTALSTGSAAPTARTDPAPALSYAINAPVLPYAIRTSVKFERNGNELIITGPPASVTPRIIVCVILFFLCITPAAAVALAMCADLPYATRDSAANGIGIGIIGLLLWGAVASLRRLIYIARGAGLPSVVRVWPDGIEVHAQGPSHPVTLRLQRDQIAYVEIHPAMGRGWVSLQIITAEDWLHVVPMPWPPGRPMIELEDNLRDVLGLIAGDGRLSQPTHTLS